MAQDIRTFSKTQHWCTTKSPKEASLGITLWRNRKDKVGEHCEITLAELYRTRVDGKPPEYSSDTWPAWSPCLFTGPRADQNAGAICLLGLDYEAKTGYATPLEVIADFWGATFGFMHTTKTHDPSNPRARVVVGLSRPVTPAEQERFYKAVLAWLGEHGHKLDSKTYNPSRIWFLPGRYKDDPANYYESRWFGGELVIDVDSILALALPLPPPHSRKGPPMAEADFFDDPFAAASRPQPPTGQPLNKARATRYANGALRNLRDRVAVAPHGERNATLNTAAYQLFRYVGSGLIDGSGVEHALAEAAQLAGLTHEETTATIISANAGLNAPAWPYEQDDLVIDGPIPPTKFTRASEVANTMAGGYDPGESTRIEVTTKAGHVMPTLGNAFALLNNELPGRLTYDTFARRLMVKCGLPNDPTGMAPTRPYRDRDTDALALWLETKSQQNWPSNVVNAAVNLIAERYSYHPVRDYLDGLEWDGTPRLSFWLQRAYGAPATQLMAEYGGCFLVGAVARIYNPGCKLDTMPIFYGPQGLGKSKSLAALFGEWFTDEIADFGTRDAAVQTQGVWGIEVAELKGLQGKDAETIKAFLSRCEDRYVQKYEKHPTTSKRQCVLFGTTNAAAFLGDETGNRRFWPVPVSKVEIEYIIANRDQLWAEAKASFVRGEPWWLTSAEAEEEQAISAEAVRELDPWQDALETHLIKKGNLEFVATADVLTALGVDALAKVSPADGRRLSRVMRALGYVPSQGRKDDKVCRGYRYRAKA